MMAWIPLRNAAVAANTVPFPTSDAVQEARMGFSRTVRNAPTPIRRNGVYRDMHPGSERVLTAAAILSSRQSTPSTARLRVSSGQLGGEIILATSCVKNAGRTWARRVSTPSGARKSARTVIGIVNARRSVASICSRSSTELLPSGTTRHSRPKAESALFAEVLKLPTKGTHSRLTIAMIREQSERFSVAGATGDSAVSYMIPRCFAKQPGT